MRTFPVLGLLTVLTGAIFAQNSVQTQAVHLPLPIEGTSGTMAFETTGPTAAVLTGLLIPSAGPLTSWAPVFSTLGADGSLKEDRPGAWVGPLPSRWIKLAKPGMVVAGFRVLVRTAPVPVQVRQIQVFWKPWTDGAVVGKVVEGPVNGAKAGDTDTVRIIEIRIPEGSIPTGLYGQTMGGKVVQASLVIRPAPAPPTSAPQAGPVPQASRGPLAPMGPSVPTVLASPEAPLLK